VAAANGIGAPPERGAPYLTTIQRLDTETGEIRVHDFGLDLAGEPILVLVDDGSKGWLLRGCEKSTAHPDRRVACSFAPRLST
jgi:hypothetical protein